MADEDDKLYMKSQEVDLKLNKHSIFFVEPTKKFESYKGKI